MSDTRPEKDFKGYPMHWLSDSLAVSMHPGGYVSGVWEYRHEELIPVRGESIADEMLDVLLKQESALNVLVDKALGAAKYILELEAGASEATRRISELEGKAVDAERQEEVIADLKNQLAGYVPAPDGHKRCSRCRKVKPLDGFSPMADGTHGRQAYCVECKAEYYREVRDSKK